MGLAILANACMPLKFWDEAFITAVFLINRTPSKVIYFATPFERLYNQQPDYSSLRVFGCACWPNLRPYNSRKLEFRSKRVSFLDIVTYIKVTNVSTSPLAESIFLEMLSLMKKYFPLRTYTLMLEHGFVLRFYCYPLPCAIILGMNN